MFTIRWSPNPAQTSTCPVCGTQDLKRRILETTAVSDAEQRWTLRVLQCSNCQARYADPLCAADYHDADRHGLKFYLEQGAGIRAMLEPLALADSRPIRNYIEIGCSFGFVMDYAKRVLGWQVRGFDPGFIAAAGKQQLQLPIENTYFTSLGPVDERADLLFCSEVIEHIPDPVTFVAQLRAALNAGGLLLLTTPNADALVPELPQELLFPLLSPGQHVILYNSNSMIVLLKQAGFHHVRTIEAGHQLLVAASSVFFEGESRHFTSGLYYRYLFESASTHDITTPLGVGLAYRLLKEEVNSSRFSEAQAVYLRIRDAYIRQYGFDVDNPESVRASPDWDFREFSQRLPCNLAGVWYSRGLIQLLYERQPHEAARMFSAAIRFGSALRNRLRAIGADDAETAALCREAEIARLRCLARFDAARAVDELAIMAHSQPIAETGALALHFRRAGRALFSELVFLGYYAMAEKALACGTLLAGSADAATDFLHDFAWALYLLNYEGDPAAAAARLSDLRERIARCIASTSGAEEMTTQFEEIEIAWLAALARCDAPAAVVAYEQLLCNQGELDGVALAAHGRRALCRLFTDFVNLGNYEAAARVLAMRSDHVEYLGSRTGEAGFAWGVYVLNHLGDFGTAAEVFGRISECADGDLLWAARFHQGLASRYLGDTATAEAVAAEIRDPGPGKPSVPDHLLARVKELFSDNVR